MVNGNKNLDNSDLDSLNSLKQALDFARETLDRVSGIKELENRVTRIETIIGVVSTIGAFLITAVGYVLSLVFEKKV